MDNTKFSLLAKKLDESAAKANPISQLSLNNSIDLGAAYEIQHLLIQQRILRGAVPIGFKMGFTSVAKMKQMGVHDMIWGRLTSDMMYLNGGEVIKTKFIHPRAEPEICFRLAKDITKEIDFDDLDDYVDAIAPAIEIIDSRYQNFKFTLEDVIADNCSSAGVVIGDWSLPSRAISQLNIILRFDDKVVAEGSSEAILGDPWRALQAATRLVTANGGSLSKGDIILAGAATEAIFLESGMDVSAIVEVLGKVSFHVA